MKIFENVRLRCLAEFNAARKTALTIDQVVFKDPRPVASIVPKPTTIKNTAVTMALLPGAPYKGETTLYYDRLDLAKAWLYAPLLDQAKILVTTETTIHELLPNLYKRLGAKFLPEDLVNDTLKLDTGFQRLRLVAAPTSLTWTGSVEILLWKVSRPTEFVLDSTQAPQRLWFKDTAVQEAVTTTPTTSKWPVQLQTYRFDYSWQAAVLKTVATTANFGVITDANALIIANALKAIDGLAWTVSASLVSYNLKGCSVWYNGKVSNYLAWLASAGATPVACLTDSTVTALLNQPFNTTYDNVLVITPNWPWVCQDGLRAVIIAHYNDVL